MCDLKQNHSFAGIVLDEAVEIVLDYSIPPALKGKVFVGSRVLVPVKSTLRKGTVWALRQEANYPSVKAIHTLASEQSVLTKDLIELAKWMSAYYSAPMHKVLKTILPSSIRNHMKELNQLVVEAVGSHENLKKISLDLQKVSAKQSLLLNTLLEMGGKTTLAKLLQKAKASKSSVLCLQKKQLVSLKVGQQERAPSWDDDYFISKAKPLSDEQDEALSKIKLDLSENCFSTHLLYGVTGSGKTEVYLQAIEEALKLDKGVIFLVPEIALTSQTIERLKSRFEEKIAILHYRLSDGEKRDAWHQIQERRAKIIIGARSAIFCPVPKLGLIIVDEEHDGAYKQTGDSPAYQGRDVAIVRAKLCNAVVLLGTATPSLESYQNAIDGKYKLSLLTQRHGKARMPEVHIVDMKHECIKKRGTTLFSDKLLTGIKSRLASGEQSLLLLNRRGYHSSQICLKCSNISQCPNCETSLTFHLSENILSCHLCDYRETPSKKCPKCQSEASLKFRGSGTELVEKKLYQIFPSCRVLRMDADTTKHKGSHDKIFKQFRSGKADILVGTQMIAKGLHFPSVTLVGVLNADLTLSIPDFRASESMFQLITQVAGRSGRGDLPGEVIVQTFLPDQATLRHAANQNYVDFFQEEATVRKLFDYPPFTHLVKLSFSGPDLEKTKETAESSRKFLMQNLPSSFEFLPVAPSGHAKIQNNYRFQFLIKTTKILAASPTLHRLQSQLKNKEISLFIDVDPSSTFF
jgi:primosomal protein N' (replication factor Y) (superfamily II helicase)